MPPQRSCWPPASPRSPCSSSVTSLFAAWAATSPRSSGPHARPRLRHDPGCDQRPGRRGSPGLALHHRHPRRVVAAGHPGRRRHRWDWPSPWCSSSPPSNTNSSGPRTSPGSGSSPKPWCCSARSCSPNWPRRAGGGPTGPGRPRGRPARRRWSAVRHHRGDLRQPPRAARRGPSDRCARHVDHDQPAGGHLPGLQSVAGGDPMLGGTWTPAVAEVATFGGRCPVGVRPVVDRRGDRDHPARRPGGPDPNRRGLGVRVSRPPPWSSPP